MLTRWFFVFGLFLSSSNRAFATSCSRYGIYLTASTSIRKFVTSPNYPSYYSSNLNCSYVVTSYSLQNPLVEIRIDHLDLERNFDYLLIYDGTKSSYAHRHSTSQSVTVGNTLRSNTSVVQITFITDRSIVKRGFNISYIAVPRAVAGGGGGIPACASGFTPYYASDATQSIQSPNYPSNYNSNSRTYWLIVKPNAEDTLTYYFEDFHLERSSFCRYDYLLVYNGACESSSVIGRYCGTVGNVHRSHRNGKYVLFKMVTDRSTNYRGFLMKYSTGNIDTGRIDGRAIAGAVVGPFVFIAVVCICYKKYRKRKTKIFVTTPIQNQSTNIQRSPRHVSPNIQRSPRHFSSQQGRQTATLQQMQISVIQQQQQSHYSPHSVQYQPSHYSSYPPGTVPTYPPVVPHSGAQTGSGGTYYPVPTANVVPVVPTAPRTPTVPTAPPASDDNLSHLYTPSTGAYMRGGESPSTKTAPSTHLSPAHVSRKILSPNHFSKDVHSGSPSYSSTGAPAHANTAMPTPPDYSTVMESAGLNIGSIQAHSPSHSPTMTPGFTNTEGRGTVSPNYSLNKAQAIPPPPDYETVMASTGMNTGSEFGPAPNRPYYGNQPVTPSTDIYKGHGSKSPSKYS